MENQNAIEVRNMSKSFKVEYDKAHTLKEKMLFWHRGNAEVHQVLKNISLDIKKGETVALIGTNGSGKSTLLKLMTRIIYPNSGSIKTYGKVTSLLELGAGFHQDFTGRENIYFNASIFGLNRSDIEKRIQQIIDFSELGHFIDNPIRTYSSGMYMRLAFSVAINVDADILLIDEILAVGDQHFQDKCYAKLEELRDSGKTIVIVTHSLGVVKQLCHRAIWIYKGEFRLDGDPTYVIDEYLKQVALDHKQEQKEAIAKGKAVHRGVVFIDRPKDFSNIKLTNENFAVEGWEISNCEESQLKVLFDGKLVEDVKRVPRSDVYEAYQDDYAGFIDADTIGWKAFVSLKGQKVGEHKINVQCIGLNDEILSEKEIQISLS
ncbi:ABC transporter ATP-binding protein [Faecalicoccus pleomorphus]|uniref:ABC transporter ATP-binding protein n=1 Tax=Faecalicoccus pleomorphus TaxID=1323 RepID=UPI00232E3482|nr:ABC transporter ATP-binding protein [Faecalicoccus pleomorphus]MDB7989483.1 ABC transporter ATP-binding protein [Faecalicoccus pleomorphus]MDB7993931.1 ABC transporter ATP-binding protein [Faecalicoccus pleomorphus]